VNCAKRHVVSFFLGTMFLTFSSLPQQVPAGSASATSAGFEGTRVTRVDIAAKPGEDLDALRALLLLQPGQLYSIAAVRDTVSKLQGMHRFTAVQVSLEPEVSGLHVTFILRPAYSIGLVSFPGAASRLSYSRLLQAVNIPPDALFVEDELAVKAKALQHYLSTEGYFSASVTSTTHVDDAHHLVNVDFRCELHERARIGSVTVSGVSGPETADVHKTLSSFWTVVAEKSLKPGNFYSQSRVDKALDNLRAHFRKTGRLASNIHAEPDYDAETKRVQLTVFIDPGPKVTVTVVGAHVWKRTLTRLLPIYQENSIDQDLVDEGKRNLVSYFQSKSYFSVKVDSQLQTQVDHVDLLYNVIRGKRHRLSQVRFEGNKHFNQERLRSHIVIEQAKLINRGKYSQDLLKKSVDSLTALYRNAGFADAKINPTVTEHDTDVQVVFHVEEGDQTQVRQLSIVDGRNQPVHLDLKGKSLRLAAGKPYSPHLVDLDRDVILSQYLSQGYPDVQFDSTTSPTGEPHAVDVIYKVDLGPSVRVRNVVLLGADQTRPKFVQQTTEENVKEGKPLSEEDLMKSESDLYTVGTFDWANVTPIATEDPTEQQVLIRVHESKRNNVDVGGGLEIIPRDGNIPVGAVVVPGLPPVSLGNKFTVSQKSFVGPRGTLQLSRRNLRGRAETATIALVASRLDQRAAFTYADPNLHGTTWSSLFSLSTERTTQNPIFTAVLEQSSFQVQAYLDRKHTQKVVTGYRFERTDLSNILIPELVLPKDQHVRVSGVYAQYIHDTRDKPLDAHSGIYQTFSFTIAPSAIGSSSNFTKFVGQTALYKQVKPWLVWANNFRLSLANPFGTDGYVPLSERFFSGGPESLRGFAIDAAGPQRPVPVCSNPSDSSTCSLISVPAGGLMLAIFNSEGRFPIPLKKDLGGVIFYDGGNVYQNINAHQFISNYSNSVGFGLRYYTRLGPIRFDLGRNLNPLPGLKATQYFITLGQSF
jgi:outer membrane protein insertion porin family